MAVMNQQKYVHQQYADDTKLSIRIKFHTTYSINKQGFASWLFEQYRFAENDTILELGCGNGGQWEGRISDLPDGCKLTLSDFSDGMVEIVETKFSSHHEKVSVQKVDIQDIPFTDASCDILIANHMLHHVPDLNKALSEVKRVLKPSGRFYAATNGNGGLMEFLRHAVKIIDPETTAFSETLTFNLQNGEKILRRYFSSVEKFDYTDALAITKTQDLMDYIDTIIRFVSFPKDKYNNLYNYFENIRKRDGAINIPKEGGLFVCNS